MLHDLGELLLGHVALLADVLLEVLNCLQVLALLFVPLLHGEALDRLVELLVLFLRLLLLELVNLLLLHKEAALHIHHMLVGFDHLCEEVHGSGDRQICLHQNRHALHDVVARAVVEVELTLQVIVDFEVADGGLDHIVFCRFLNGHVLAEGDATLLLDELC